MFIINLLNCVTSITIADSNPGVSIPPPPPPPPIQTLVHVSGSQSQDRMKKLNWKVLTPHNFSKDCFWAILEGKDGVHAEEKEILDELIKHFSLPNQNVFKRSAAKSQIILRVLDGNAAQNLLISLRVLSKYVSYNQIKQHILHCYTSVLNPTFIDTLIKYLPPPHKMAQLREMSKNGVELVDIEQFLASLGDIEHLAPRLHAINLKMGFNDIVKDLEPNIIAGTSACEEVISSKKFGQVLTIILSIGNLMNSGSIRFGANGFDLAILAKLHDVKSSNRKYTLFHFIVDTIQRKFPECLNLTDELGHVAEAARFSFDHIKKTIENITESSEKLEQDLRNASRSRSSEDKFVEVMSPFALECRRQIEVLTNLMHQMDNSYIKVAKHFAFDVNKCPMEDFLRNINTFKNLFYEAFKDLNGTVPLPGSVTTVRKSKPQFCKVKLKRLTRKGLFSLRSYEFNLLYFNMILYFVS